MPITEIQRERRKSKIGSSDMAAIMGFDPNRNAADVYWSKINNLEDFDAGDAANLGNFLEDGIMRWAANELGGRRIIRNQYRVSEDGLFGANCDALFPDFPEGLEAKSTGWYNGQFDGEEWGEPGTAEVPTKVLFQAMHQIYAARLERVWVPSLISGRGAQLYRVERREDLIEKMIGIANHFWDFVENETPPPNMTPHIETLKRIAREEGKSIEFPDELWATFDDCGKRKSAIEKEYKGLQEEVLTVLGDAEQGVCSHGGGVTYFEQNSPRKADWDKLERDFPEAYTACVIHGTNRVLRRKNPPKEKKAKVTN